MPLLTEEIRFSRSAGKTTVDAKQSIRLTFLKRAGRAIIA